MPLTPFPPQPPDHLRVQHRQELHLICLRSRTKLLQVGARRLLLELTIKVSELKRSPGRVIAFPNVPTKKTVGGSRKAPSSK